MIEGRAKNGRAGPRSLSGLRDEAFAASTLLRWGEILSLTTDDVAVSRDGLYGLKVPRMKAQDSEPASIVVLGSAAAGALGRYLAARAPRPGRALFAAGTGPRPPLVHSRLRRAIARRAAPWAGNPPAGLR